MGVYTRCSTGRSIVIVHHSSLASFLSLFHKMLFYVSGDLQREPILLLRNENAFRVRFVAAVKPMPRKQFTHQSQLLDTLDNCSFLFHTPW